jgi:hypothetical protein
MDKGRKRSFPTGLLLIIVVSVVLISCCGLSDIDQSDCSICGRYVPEGRPTDFLDINEDGTFKHQSTEDWGTLCVQFGDWEFSGEVLVLRWPNCGYKVELSVQGNIITYFADDKNVVYIKQ